MTDLLIQIIPAGRGWATEGSCPPAQDPPPHCLGVWGSSRLLGPAAARPFLSSLVFALPPPPLEETSVRIRWALQAARAQPWGWQPAGSGSLTGTRAGCAAPPGRTPPGAGPRLASPDPGAQPHSAGCSASESRSRHLPDSRVPRRGQPPAVAPRTPEVSVGRKKCSKPWAPPPTPPRHPGHPWASVLPRPSAVPQSHRQLDGQSGHPQGICALPLPGSLSLLGHLHRHRATVEGHLKGHRMGFGVRSSAQAAWGASPLTHSPRPPGPAQPEPPGPGWWSRIPPSHSSGASRKQSRFCPPRSQGGLGGKGGLSKEGSGRTVRLPVQDREGLSASTQSGRSRGQGWAEERGHGEDGKAPPPGQGASTSIPTSIHVDAALEGCKELFALEHLHRVRGLGAPVPLQQPPKGGVHLRGSPCSSGPKALHPTPALWSPPCCPPARAPTLFRGRHCSRTCSGSRRRCRAMRFTRCSRSRSQAFRARPPTQFLVVYQSQYLGELGVRRAVRTGGGGLRKLGGTDQEKCVTWKRAYRWVSSRTT